jgi:hypothetical protein
MLRITIDTSNAAFDDDACESELSRILSTIAPRVAAGEDGGTLRDVNGNTIGGWTTDES